MDIEQAREQIVEEINMLWRHKEQGAMVSYSFIRDHARVLMELSEQMLPIDQRTRARLPAADDLPAIFSDPDPEV